MICARCLAQQVASPPKARKRISFPVAAVFQCLFAVVIVWLLFLFVAQTLSDIPDDFHDGTIWE